MRILLVGSGSREHAIAWKLKSSPMLEKLWVWPSNAGIAMVAETLDLPSDAPFAKLAEFIKAKNIDAVICGPEQPLADGMANELAGHNIPVFGPRQEAALLESSKSFAKDVMEAAKIPTAAYEVATTEQQCRDISERMLKEKGAAVIKASGLAAGKGVFVCTSKEDIENGLKRLYQTSMKAAAEQVVVEECLIGRECSYFALVGKNEAFGVGFAVDFKRLKDGDQGPNTGGMGTYTPVPWLPSNAADLVHDKVIDPLIAELNKRAIEYTGFLYVGLMWSEDKGPQVVEFNVRLGDPEAQVLAVADDRDWLAMIAENLGIKEKTKHGPMQNKKTVGVVIASEGYPYDKALSHAHFDKAQLMPEERSVVFTAAVKANGDKIDTASGRVMTVVGSAESFDEARNQAYKRVDRLTAQWPKAQFRRDIALRAVKEESS